MDQSRTIPSHEIRWRKEAGTVGRRNKNREKLFPRQNEKKRNVNNKKKKWVR